MINRTVGDITEYSGDCIFNSLGEGARMEDEPGRIFASILEAINYDRRYAYEIHRNSYRAKIGDSFITDSYGLPCKKIVNIVTPFKEDDPDCSFFKQTILDAFQLAYDNGCRTMCIPLIGSGFNAYSRDESFQTIFRCSKDFCSRYADVDITVLEPSDCLKLNSDSYERSDRNWRSSREFSIESGIAGYFEEVEEHRRVRERRSSERCYGPSLQTPVVSILEPNISLGEVLDTYIEKNRDEFPGASNIKKTKKDKLVAQLWYQIFENIRLFSNRYVDSENYLRIDYLYQRAWAMRKSWRRHKLSDKSNAECWVKPSKLQVIIAGITLGMERNDILNLCTFCGYYLSKYDEGDRALMRVVSMDSEEGRLDELDKTYPQARGYKSFDEVPVEKGITIIVNSQK